MRLGTNPVLVKKEATGRIDRPTHRTQEKIKVEMGLTLKVQQSARTFMRSAEWSSTSSL